MDEQMAQIKYLIEENKLTEARTALKQWVSQDLSDEEKGQILVETASTYMTLMNDINDKYLEMMDAELAQLKEVNQLIADNDQAIDVTNARQTIKES